MIHASFYEEHWWWVKFVGGAYLIYLSLHYWWTSRKEKNEEKGGPEAKERNFWMTVVIGELTDIAFAVDSILAAIALPAYQDYTIRAKMSEVILGMSACRTSITEVYQSGPAGLIAPNGWGCLRSTF